MNPMVDQVHRIVYNLLASEYAVYIPSVGSLLVERVPARRLSKRRIMPPYYAVIFTSHAVGTSLVDAIAQAAECDAEAAQEVLHRWLTRATREGVLTIGGVGVLKQKSFAVDPSFDKTINPQERTPVSVRPAGGSHWFFWTAASIAVFCGLGACGWILYDRMAEERFADPAQYREQAVVQPQQSQMEQTPADSLVLRNELPVSAGVEGVAALDQQRENTLPESQGNPTASQTSVVAPEQSALPSVQGSLVSAKMTPGYSYVVLGVFSTEQNAQRAAREAMKADPSLQCGVWYYGNKFMASFFASDDAAACAAFVNAHGEHYPETWSYKAR